jgi:hypothetical protein
VRVLRNILYICFCIAVLLCSAPVTGDERPQVMKNGDILDSLCAKVISSLMMTQSIGTKDTIVVMFTETPANSYFRPKVIEYLLDNKRPIFGNISTGIPSVQFTFNPPVIEYITLSSLPLFGSQLVHRSVTLSCTFIASNSEGRVSAASTVVHSMVDTIAQSQIFLVENSPIEMTHGILLGKNLYERLVEPAVILGAVGVSIYLFFTIRS